MTGALVSALAFTILGNLHSLALENIGVSEGLAITQLGCMVMGSPKAWTLERKKNKKKIKKLSVEKKTFANKQGNSSRQIRSSNHSHAPSLKLQLLYCKHS